MPERIIVLFRMPRQSLGARLAAKLECVKQLEEELETTDDDNDEDLILCRYCAAESTGVSGTDS